MDNKEYGVKLTVDISDLQKKLDKAVDITKKATENIKAPLENIKVKKAELKYETQERAVADANKLVDSQSQKVKSLNNIWYATTQEIERTKKEIQEVSKEIEKMEEYHKDVNAMFEKYNFPMQERVDFDNIMKDRAKAFGLEKLTRKSENLPVIEQARWEELQKAKEELEKLTFEYEKQKKVLEIYGLEVEAAKNEVQDMGNKQKETKEEVSDLGERFDKLGKNIGSSIKSAVSSLKRFSLSLFGIQSAYSVLSRAVRSYMAYDAEANARIQANWIALGAMFAPIVEKIVKWIQKLVAYINVFYKALTGKSFIQTALDKVKAKANGTSKAIKGLNKELANFDEITNLNFDKGTDNDVDFDVSDALGELNEIELDPEIVKKIEGIADWILKIKENFDNLGISVGDVVKGIALIFSATEVGRIVSGIAQIIGVSGGTSGLYGMITALTIIDTYLAITLVNDLIELNKQLKKEEEQDQRLGDNRIKTMKLINDQIQKIKDSNLDEATKQKEINTLLEEGQGEYKSFKEEIIEGSKYTKEQREEMDKQKKTMEELTNTKWKGTVDYEINAYQKESSKQWWKKFYSEIMEIAGVIAVGGPIGAFLYPLIRTIQYGILGQDFGENLNWLKGKSIGGLKFAKGNVAYGPTVAEFGEYAGARSNPEITAPQNIMKQTMIEALQEALPQGGSRGGDTILYVNGKELARATYNDYKTEGNRLGTSGVAVRRV